MSTDRDALARVISGVIWGVTSGGQDHASRAAADAVIAHLAATGPRDAGLREVAVAAVNHAANLLRQSRPGDAYDNIDPGPPLRDIARRFAAGEFDAALAAPDPGPSPWSGHQHGAVCIYSSSHGWTCPAPARDTEDDRPPARGGHNPFPGTLRTPDPFAPAREAEE